jgi:hypothetical protein
MLLKNLSTARGLVNGARGTVVGFQKHDDTKYQLLPLCTFQVFLGSQMAEETIVIERDTWDIRQGERCVVEIVMMMMSFGGDYGGDRALCM